VIQTVSSIIPSRREASAALCSCASWGSCPSDQKSANMTLTSAKSLRDEQVARRVLANDRPLSFSEPSCEGGLIKLFTAKNV
jgi:hypothetical protein